MPLNSRYKSIIELGLLLGLAILMAIALSFGITIFLGGSSHPTVAVTTGSMLPIYNGFQDDDGTDIYPFRGDILLVKKVPIETIEVGDVIVFNTSNDKRNPPVVHRVIATWESNGEYFFETNGDNNDITDTNRFITTGNDVKGVVVFRIPHIGWFLLVVQTTLGKIIILVFAILILFVGDESEEDTPSSEEKTEFIHQHDSRNIISYFISIGKRILQKKSYTYAVLALFVIFLFLCVNLLSSFQYPPSVKLYRTDDELRVANLMISPSPLTNCEKLDEITNQTIYFFHIQIEIQSGGVFNNIDRIEIRVNETKGFYSWNTVYNFVGTRVFKGGIIAIMNGSSTITASVSVALYSRGIFASSPQITTFPISLRSG